MDEEFWTQRDGTSIAVGDMDEDHLRNTLRMILRNRRRRALKFMPTVFGPQAMLNSEHHRALANPNCFFPLLDGGVYGSADLQKKYGGSI